MLRTIIRFRPKLRAGSAELVRQGTGTPQAQRPLGRCTGQGTDRQVRQAEMARAAADGLAPPLAMEVARPADHRRGGLLCL